MMPAKVTLGQVYATPGALAAIPIDEISAAIGRHRRCDWGEVDAEDKATNDRALACGGRLVSAYTSSEKTRFWIITEADRSATTVLLPEEY